MCKLLGYDKLFPMNSGVEATETAVKLARKWAYNVKGVPDDQAVILLPTGTYWGRSITAGGACTDPLRYTGFGPFTGGFDFVEFNNLEDLEAKIKANKNIAGFLIECIQGEAGVIIPDDGYISKAYKLCKDNNVLFMADEV